MNGDPFDWMDDPLSFWHGLLAILAVELACFAAAAFVALFLAHYPG